MIPAAGPKPFLDRFAFRQNRDHSHREIADHGRYFDRRPPIHQPREVRRRARPFGSSRLKIHTQNEQGVSRAINESSFIDAWNRGFYRFLLVQSGDYSSLRKQLYRSDRRAFR